MILSVEQTIPDEIIRSYQEGAYKLSWISSRAFVSAELAPDWWLNIEKNSQKLLPRDIRIEPAHWQNLLAVLAGTEDSNVEIELRTPISADKKIRFFARENTLSVNWSSLLLHDKSYYAVSLSRELWKTFADDMEAVLDGQNIWKLTQGSVLSKPLAQGSLKNILARSG
jgi:hypothetical protein